MKIAVDTNILVYADGVNGEERRMAAQAVLASIPPGKLVIPVQVLGEFANVLLRKSKRPVENVRANADRWQLFAICVPTDAQVFSRAMDLAAQHYISIWDAIIFAAASEAGCRVLLSEDMQHGFVWGGVKLINPFSSESNAMLARMLGP